MRLHALIHLLSVSALSLCAGCLWWPDHGLRLGIRTESRAALEPGRVTREDVLCELGAPHWASVDGKRFVYWSCEYDSMAMVYIVVEGAELFWGKDHYLLFEFDEAGVLRVQRERTRGFSCSGFSGHGVPDAAGCEALFATSAPGS